MKKIFLNTQNGDGENGKSYLYEPTTELRVTMGVKKSFFFCIVCMQGACSMGKSLTSGSIAYIPTTTLKLGFWGS